MSENTIHPTAVIEPGASLGNGVKVEPYAVIRSGVTLKDGVTVKAHAYLDGCTFVGEGTTIWPSVVIGTATQDKKYRGEHTEVHIGRRCDIREFTTINSSCGEGGQVTIGDDCLIMTACHVAHNCSVGHRVVMANNAVLAGHVAVDDDAIIGGMTPVHQFCRIGRYAMVGGLSRVTHDVPPYTIGAGIPFKVGGLNLVGLKRHKFPLEVRRLLSRAFKIVYRSGIHLDEALTRIEGELEQIPEIQHLLHFCRSSKRGLIGLQQAGQGELQEMDLCEEEELQNSTVC